MPVADDANKYALLIWCIFTLLLWGHAASAQSLGDPVVRITFGSGTTSRGGALSADSGSTTYIYSASGQIGENYYTITNQVNTTVHGGFVTSYDHGYETSGKTDGYMMVVNGNLTAGTVFTRTVEGLCGNTQYQFGVWIKNVLSTSGILPNMVFHIYAADGVTELGSGISTGDVPTGNIWHNYTANFTLPAGTEKLVIKLVSNASGQTGNDFAVDDITFSPYGSTVAAVFSSSAGTTSTTAATCAGSGEKFTISATSSLGTGYVQKLQMYSNGAWEDLSIGGTNTSFTITAPSAAGTYPYRLVSALADNISSANCVVSSNQLTLTVRPSPAAAFMVSPNTCLGNTTNFTDASESNGTTINTWDWDFGDGKAHSTTQNPVHIYDGPGDYMVTLTLPGSNGCSASVSTQTVHISALPVAAFTFTAPVCLGNVTTFTDKSTSLEGTLATWIWDFGDGSFSNVQNPTYIYKTSGTYTVKLTVISSNGCTAVPVTQTVVVSPLPVAGFTVPAVCLTDASATFVNTSTVADNSALSYLWNFGDGNATAANPNTSTAKSPSHKYTRAAVYQVTLTVTSPNGCAAVSTQSLTVNGAIPVAGFTVANASQLCSNDQVVFTNTSTVDFGSITKIEWYYDYLNNPAVVEVDNSPSPGKLYNHMYTAFNSPVTKTYTVRMVAYSGGSCASVHDEIITLRAIPVISFAKPAAICLNAGTIQLQARETSGLAGIGVYNGTGVSSTGLFNPVVAGAGTFNIIYTYTATNGCPESVSQSITVNPAPLASAGPDITVLEGGTAALPATATGDGLTYSWTPVNNLDNPTALNPVVSPTGDAIYTLVVTNSSGCAVIAGKVSVSVLKGPVIVNTFTPNGDGINDLWNIKYLDTYTDCTVEIFNRYGTKVFYSLGYSTPWDGTCNGAAVPAGVYYYIINPKHGRKVLSGSLTVLR